MEPLNNKQKRKLKGLAQKLDASLKVGKQGVTPAFLKNVRETFQHHELLKLKFEEHRDQKEELAEQIAAQTQSHLVTIVGHVAVFYRQHPDAAKRKIELPVGPDPVPAA